MNVEDEVSIFLPGILVDRAESEGLNVPETCRMALERGIEALENIGDENQNHTSHYGSNNPDNHTVSFSEMILFISIYCHL